MWYKIYQHKFLKPGRDPIQQEILLDLDKETYELAKKLGIKIVVEIDSLTSIVGSWGNNEITAIARLTVPGLLIEECELPTIQEACVSIIRMAHDPTKIPNESHHLYRWRDKSKSRTGRLGSNPPIRRQKRKTRKRT